MELYKDKNWDIIFGDWCQEFLGYCIIGNDKESLSDLIPGAWEEFNKYANKKNAMFKWYKSLSRFIVEYDKIYRRKQ